MPRVIAPDSPREPAAVISLPRAPATLFQPADQQGRALQRLGGAIAGLGQDVLAQVVDQERRAETLRIKTEAARRYGELRRRVDAEGSSTDARALWDREAARLKQELVRFAEQRGMPELAGELDHIAVLEDNETQAALGKRAWREAVDAAEAFAAAKGEAIVGAASEVEAQRHRTELHRALEQLAAGNPIFSAGAADALFQSTVSGAAVRRAQGAIARAADDPDALRRVAASIREGRFADLSADDRAILAERAENTAERAELHNLEMLDRIEARQERLARRSREATESELRVRVARGEITEGELVDALDRRAISVDAFNGLISAMRTDAAQADHPATALALRERIYLGDADSADVFSAFGDGLLSQSTAEELLNLADQVSRRGESVLDRDDVKRARRYLDDVIGGLRGPLAVLDPAESERVANGLREFDARVLAGDDPWQAADALAAQYRATPPSVTSFGRPLYLVGSPSSPDIEASMQATIDAFSRGEIDQATAAREIERLEQIERAMRDRDALHKQATAISPRPR